MTDDDLDKMPVDELRERFLGVRSDLDEIDRTYDRLLDFMEQIVNAMSRKGAKP